MLQLVVVVLLCIGLASVVKAIYNKGFVDGRSANVEEDGE